MSNVKIITKGTKNLPWQEKPAGCNDIVWRHTENPIIGWNPTPSTARVYNSAVAPYGDGFIGVFRADHKDGKARIHLGHSKDGLKWDIDDEPIKWVDEDGRDYQPNYSYDPRLVQIDVDNCCCCWTFYWMRCRKFI